MIAHALHIIVNELNRHFHEVYAVPTDKIKVEIGNIGRGIGTDNGNVAAEEVILSLVNYKEEKTLKNLPNYVRNDSTLRVTYENQPVFLNFMILMSATHNEYSNAITDLSRVIRFFQAQNVFTPENVSPQSIIQDPVKFKALDGLESFKLIFDLYSPTFEEVNHLWGTLGGKQFPFVLYMMRLLDLKFKSVQSESGLITAIQSDFYHKNPVNS